MEGSFVEQPSHAHVRLRHELLDGGQVLPPPPSVSARSADFVDVVQGVVLEGLRRQGLAVIQWDEPLSNDQFLSLGSLLGTPIPETDLAVMPYVERGVILNLVSAHERTADVSLQPFATNYLTLHTESSGRPADQQPRYIVLLCDDPGDSATSAQTVLVPMAKVERLLSPARLARLRRTRYRNTPGSPPIVRELDGRLVFSFRDFVGDTLEWATAGDDAGPGDVNDAFAGLLASMYGTPAMGVHWTSRLLVVIDNTFFFHGRTAGAGGVNPARRRHLRRLRIR
jgi:hypothetical protein